MMFLFLFSCSTDTFPDYWPDASKHPSITSISPEAVSGMLGGQTIRIEGSLLGSTKTVVIGDRNAEIISTDGSFIEVVVPANTAGGGAVDVVLATEDGMARLVEGFIYNSLGSDWWRNENASVVASRLECPVEAWALAPGDEWTSLLWCGFEMGYSWGNAVIGKERQAGFAGDLSGFHPLSALPSEGESAFWGIDDEKPLALPSRYSPFLIDDNITLQTTRDFEDDLDFVYYRMDQLEEYYTWWDYVTALYPVVAFYDDESCWLGEASVEGVTSKELIVDSAVAGATGILVGYEVEEDYEGEPYYSQGFTTSAEISIDGDTLTSHHSGLTIAYDDYSGQFFSEGVNEQNGVQDIPFRSNFTVRTSLVGEDVVLGAVQSMAELNITAPDIISGLSQMDQAFSFDITWTPISSAPPSVVVAEIRIYDFGVDNPNGWHEVARLVRSANPSDGEISFEPIDLLKLPITPNRVDDDYDLVGYWGELTVSHHQLRKISNGEGEMVIDFIHAIQAPIDVINSNLE